jgi:hypothetical protein
MDMNRAGRAHAFPPCFKEKNSARPGLLFYPRAQEIACATWGA